MDFEQYHGLVTHCTGRRRALVRDWVLPNTERHHIIDGGDPPIHIALDTTSRRRVEEGLRNVNSFRIRNGIQKSVWTLSFKGMMTHKGLHEGLMTCISGFRGLL